VAKQGETPCLDLRNFVLIGYAVQLSDLKYIIRIF